MGKQGRNILIGVIIFIVVVVVLAFVVKGGCDEEVTPAPEPTRTVTVTRTETPPVPERPIEPPIETVPDIDTTP